MLDSAVAEATAQRVNGTVKLVKPSAFAIIVPDAGGDDVFVSWSELRACNMTKLTGGDAVSYVPTKGREGKGPRGVQVQKH